MNKADKISQIDKKAQRLAGLKKKQDQLNAQIQQLEATVKSRERKQDTRRKILIGAYYLDKAKKDKTQWEGMVKLMALYLKRNADRILFDLAPLETNQKD